jgi:IclR family transcriptional regulator, acetate operon repressor
MLDVINQDHTSGSRKQSRVRLNASAARRKPRATPAGETLVKSATRALEIIELLGLCHGALSVSDIAGALDIPQSSSSILLQALKKAGFIDRDRQTRRYVPSMRSAFLGHRLHCTMFENQDLLRSLDRLSVDTGCSVRLAMRNGLYVQYAYVSWPEAGSDPLRLRPGTLVPICQDALGAVLLLNETEDTAQAIVRHANAVFDGKTIPRVRSDTYLGWLARCRQDGFAEAESFDASDETALAIHFRTPQAVSAAIGLSVPRARVDAERSHLLERLYVAANLGMMLHPAPVS